MEKRPALGKGLSALIPDVPEVRLGTGPTEVDVDLISPNEHQPRQRFEDVRLEELARSIKANGVIQPIVVRKVDGGYRIIAGERRWRAAQRAGLTRVPVVVKEIPAGQDAQVLEIALIENIQREDLNPIDEAAAYEKLSSDFNMTQEEIAAAVGKDRSSVANHLRLLKLPQEVRAEVAGGRLSMGHARALLAIADEGGQRHVAREVIAQNLSVRETEAMVKRFGHAVSARPQRARCSGCAHARRRREAEDDARNTRPYRPKGQKWKNRNRFRFGRRITAAVRATHGPRQFISDTGFHAINGCFALVKFGASAPGRRINQTMTSRTAAARYARALLDVATKESVDLETIARELDEFLTFLKQQLALAAPDAQSCRARAAQARRDGRDHEAVRVHTGRREAAHPAGRSRSLGSSS